MGTRAPFQPSRLECSSAMSKHITCIILSSSYQTCKVKLCFAEEGLRQGVAYLRATRKFISEWEIQTWDFKYYRSDLSMLYHFTWSTYSNYHWSNWWWLHCQLLLGWKAWCNISGGQEGFIKFGKACFGPLSAKPPTSVESHSWTCYCAEDIRGPIDVP